MKRRHFLKTMAQSTASLSLAALSGCQPTRKPNPNPNIIFILVDDMRWDQLSVMGHPFIKTPNLDRIGKEGMIFHNAFVCTPLCSPSRASFLTGQYPHKHRIINNDRNGLASISHKMTTFPQVLRRSGYETAFIGKWHMGDDDTRRPGFDHWISFRGQGLFLDPVVNVDGERRQCTGYMTDLLNKWTLQFINKKHTKPFLLYLSHKAVHAPFIPAKRHKKLYSNALFSQPPIDSEDIAGKPALRRAVPPVDVLRLPGATPEPMEPRYGHSNNPKDIYLDHARCLASVDEGVGQILDALEKIGDLDDTLIIFASDNGFLFGEHGEFRNKRVAYEESLRIPLLMRYPKLIKPGSKREQLVLNLDIAPTLYDIVGAQPPVKMHGKSLLPIIDDPSTKIRTEILAEYFLEKITPKHASWQAVRSENWKYIRYPDLEGMDELYDLQADPKELKNVIDSSQHESILKEAQTKLSRLLEESETPAHLLPANE
jgi:arylsulfatase A-like enzyme